MKVSIFYAILVFFLVKLPEIDFFIIIMLERDIYGLFIILLIVYIIVNVMFKNRF